MPPTMATVTTLRDAEQVLRSFIDYHLAVGLAPLYLFFDDPLDPGLDVARSYPEVVATPCDAALRDRWRSLPSYGELEPYLDSHVMARQILNAELAIAWARERGCDWLLHIDIDELFFLADRSLARHLEELERQGLDCITYPNHEAVPETEAIADYFLEVTLFKRSYATLPPERRSTYQPFLYYPQGKSAVRLRPGVRPRTVHDFSLPAERGWLYRHVLRHLRPKRAPLLVDWHGSWLDRIFPQRARRRARTMSDRPAILHYPCCGFEHFWRKYQTLGNFPDRWFDTIPIARLAPFHLRSRDTFLRGDRSAALQLFREEVLLEGNGRVEKGLQAGSLLRIRGPVELLDARRSGRAPARVDLKAVEPR